MAEPRKRDRSCTCL